MGLAAGQQGGAQSPDTGQQQAGGAPGQIPGNYQQMPILLWYITGRNGRKETYDAAAYFARPEGW